MIKPLMSIFSKKNLIFSKKKRLSKFYIRLKNQIFEETLKPVCILIMPAHYVDLTYRYMVSFHKGEAET